MWGLSYSDDTTTVSSHCDCNVKGMIACKHVAFAYFFPSGDTFWWVYRVHLSAVKLEYDDLFISYNNQ